MVEFLKSLVSVGRRVLRVENQDNVHESNTNVKENLKRLYLSISYISRAGSKRKSKVTSTKHSLRPSEVWFREKDSTNIRNIVSLNNLVNPVRYSLQELFHQQKFFPVKFITFLVFLI